MKKITLALVSLGGLAVLGVCLRLHQHAPPTAPEAAAGQIEAQPAPAPRPPQTARPEATPPSAMTPEPVAPSAAATGPLVVAALGHAEANPLFDQSIQVLLSPRSTYDQRQAAWKQMKHAGQLDQAITQLEQRVGAGTGSSEETTALGQAYWQKCAGMKDFREQAILAMEADKAFGAALNLDPNNWEARFTKALAMSYWPKDLNKGPEVVSQLTTLIQQQETLPQQPEFTRSYMYLGDQYEKAGQSDYAKQVWQRGAAWFPQDTELRKRLASVP